jgi:hypothetical protein
VGLIHRSRGNADDDAAVTPPTHAFGTDAEDPVVRQYRFLLRTAPPDALEAAHVEALPALDPDTRAAVLAAVQERLVAGLRLGPDDITRLAHLVTLGERRAPGYVVGGLDSAALLRLSEAVIASEASFGLFTGYAAWDGTEPEVREPRGDMAGFDETWHQHLHRIVPDSEPGP